MGLSEWLMLGVLSLLWGGSFIFNEMALESFPPFSLVFCRVVIGALMLTLILRARGIAIPLDGKSWKLFAVMAIFQNVVPFSLIVWGQQYISAGLASIFNSTTPFFTVLIAQFFLSDEKISGSKLMGLIFGFIGVVIIIGPEALDGLTDAGLGKFAVLGAAFCYGISLVWGRRFANYAPGVAPAGMLWCSSLMMVPLMLVDGKEFVTNPTVYSVGAVLGIGILSSALAYLLFFLIIKRAGATNASLVTMIVPISAVVMGYLFLGEVLTWQTLPGVLLIFVGLIFVDGRLFTKLRAKPAA